MEFEPNIDPFSFENPQKTSFFPLPHLQPLEKVNWDDEILASTESPFANPAHLFERDGLIVKNLNVFGDEKLEDHYLQDDISCSESSIPENEPPSGDDSEIGEIWSLESISTFSTSNYTPKTWDAPLDSIDNQAGPSCLSEAGSHGFDAALVYRGTQSGLEDSGRVSRTDIFMNALFKLGLGWNSVFFRFNEQTRKFEKHIRDVRISGLSLPALDGLIEYILQLGTQMRWLRKFVATVSAQPEIPRALAGLSRMVFVILYSLEDQLAERSRSSPSLLETQTIFGRVGCLIKGLVDITHNVNKSVADAEIVSTVFTKCDQYSHQYTWLADILQEIMSVTGGVWLRHVTLWIGLRACWSKEVDIEGSLPLHSLTAETNYNDGIPFPMPNFVETDVAEAIYDTARGIALLRSSREDHPLVTEKAVEDSASPSLEWGLTWEDIDRIQQMAKSYELSVRDEILLYNITHQRNLHKFDSPCSSGEDPCIASSLDKMYCVYDLEEEPNFFKDTKQSHHLRSNKLYHLIKKTPFFDTDKTLCAYQQFGPPLVSAFSLSFAPIISAQFRLVNFSCLHLLFKTHKIRNHLQLQQRFQLLGDGNFLLRLSLTLFDPDLHSGERKAGIVRGGSSTGLRLGSRNTWPPASSELRLVLSGLLLDCCNGQSTSEHPRKTDDPFESSKDLPGGLSFAIRELTGEDISRCKNPNSLEALDFLRIQYTVPHILEEVITSRSLRKYDRIFKFQLRLLRMVFVARELIRSQPGDCSPGRIHKNFHYKFRFEAFQFVQAVSDYSQHASINQTWQRFEKMLLKIEKCLDAGDFEGTLNQARSVSQIREYHEKVLDHIIDGIFLSPRHIRARKILEDTFRTILTFSLYWKVYWERMSSLTAAEKIANTRLSFERSARDLHCRFRKQVRGLIHYLKILDSGGNGGLKQDRDAVTPFGCEIDADMNGLFAHLLVRLDFVEFYSNEEEVA
ncbi:hypothetical protein FQN57_003876 [Myotisia sp. PD_48]|nr:hypothetical protein FQN57_003876 [Myotisia sp. PD_48]